MHTPRITRRQFLKGCGAAAAVGAVGPRLVFGPEAHAQSATPGDTVVMLFLRGGMDGLNLVVPIAGADRVAYEQARPNLAIAASGAYGAPPLTLAGEVASGFGLHPSASGLRDLWIAGRLAIVHACGVLGSASRSHFDAQLAIERGLAQGTTSGWLGRAIDTDTTLAGSVLPALAAGATQPSSLAGSPLPIAMDNPVDFTLNHGAWAWQKTVADSPAGHVGLNETLNTLWGGPTALEAAGARADGALRTIARQPYSAVPAGWPTSTVARQLWTIAQSIKFGMGLRYATVDLGGWDTHDGQGTAGAGYHYYQNKIAELSAALAAFQGELEANGLAGRVTTVVQSEFGRRIKQNSSGGTDHGYGNPMIVMGGSVNGRRFYGTWPGLSAATIAAANGDLPVTTDYRRVMSEILVRRLRHPSITTVFPQLAYAPLGLLQGSDAITGASQPMMAADRANASPAPMQTAEDLRLEHQLRARGTFADRIVEHHP
ncbi:DUF1501 domain-containing protein [Lysobacter humi (ex Lee et al. 2017)]